MDLIEDQTDDAGRNELAEAGPSARRVPPYLAAAGIAAAAGALFLAWSVSRPRETVALAVPAGGAESARQALVAAGIPVESRDGALFVPAADAARAAMVAAPGPAPNAVAAALEDESIFASGESSRARRTAAVIRELEASIAMQPGVERASVVLGDAPRTFAPGAQGGATASVTVRMRAGAMPEDLVDAVATLVAGACPGMRPESVAIVDARAGRVRTIRGADARAEAESRRGREDRAAQLVLALLSDIPGVEVRVRESDGGATLADVAIPAAVAAARAELDAGGDGSRYLAEERERIAARIEPLLAGPSGCPVAVAVSVTQPSLPGDARAERTRPEPSYGDPSPASLAELSAARERFMPLGSGSPDAGFPVAWSIVAVLGVGFMAWWTWRQRTAPAAALAAAGPDIDVPDFESEPLPGAEASDAVRASPDTAAEVLGAWVDAGHDELAARLVVALDAPASAAVLRAMPVAQVQRVTEALGTLDAVGHDDLAEAVDAFLAEVGEHGSGGYRGGPEAP